MGRGGWLVWLDERHLQLLYDGHCSVPGGLLPALRRYTCARGLLGARGSVAGGPVTNQQSMAQPSSDDWLGHLLGEYGRSSLSHGGEHGTKSSHGRLHG